MADARKAHKPIYRTISPFTAPKMYYPSHSLESSSIADTVPSSKLPQPQCDIITDLLLNTLNPIGTCRANLPKSSKRTSEKRKRRTVSQQTDWEAEKPGPGPMTAVLTPPEIKKHVLVGFNSVTRHLENLSVHSRETMTRKASESRGILPPLAAVILFRPLDDLIYACLPTLCYTASLAHPESPPTRLVLLEPLMEAKLAAAMAHSQGVSLLAIQETASHLASAKALIDYIRENVEAIEVPWLKEGAEARWLGTKIDVQ